MFCFTSLPHFRSVLFYLEMIYDFSASVSANENQFCSQGTIVGYIFCLKEICVLPCYVKTNSAVRLIMSATPNFAGIVKKRLTGNQRRKLRNMQAASLGISGGELLFRRRAMMEEWRKEKDSLISSRCPNCGAVGHSFKWCPFANDSPSCFDEGTRFRGHNGSWSCYEPALELSLEERQRFEQYFKFLNTPVGATSKNANIHIAPSFLASAPPPAASAPSRTPAGPSPLPQTISSSPATYFVAQHHTSQM